MAQSLPRTDFRAALCGDDIHHRAQPMALSETATAPWRASLDHILKRLKPAKVAAE